jgi:RNA polymerase sigma-70 factor, ECF subfamily
MQLAGTYGGSSGHSTNPAEDERALVECARTEPAAFAALYERHVDRLYAYVLGCLHDRMAAEDVVAETFRRALEFLPRYSWRGVPFSAWLYRTAGNVIASRARRAPIEPLDGAPEVADSGPEPEAALLQGERRQIVRDAIATLPLLQRQVVLLRYAGDLPHRDIAIILGRSEGAIRVLLHRAQRTLQQRLGDYAWKPPICRLPVDDGARAAKTCVH